MTEFIDFLKYDCTNRAHQKGKRIMKIAVHRSFDDSTFVKHQQSINQIT